MPMIGIARDPSWAPCCFILCNVAAERQYNWRYQRDESCDDKKSQLVQLDWDYPGIASAFGWSPRKFQTLKHRRDRKFCEHDGCDGTVDCPCGATASDFIASAREHLDNAADAALVVEDPGYFA